MNREEVASRHHPSICHFVELGHFAALAMKERLGVGEEDAKEQETLGQDELSCFCRPGEDLLNRPQSVPESSCFAQAMWEKSKGCGQVQAQSYLRSMGRPEGDLSSIPHLQPELEYFAVTRWILLDRDYDDEGVPALAEQELCWLCMHGGDSQSTQCPPTKSECSGWSRWEKPDGEKEAAVQVERDLCRLGRPGGDPLNSRHLVAEHLH